MTFDEFLNEWSNKRDFITVRTSGSTGVPKHIRLRKEFVKDSALRTINYFGLKSGARYHSCVSADFIGGKMMAVRACIGNGDLTWEEPSNQPLQSIKKNQKIDLLAVVPSQMLYVLDNLEILPVIKNIIIGGGQIHPDLRKKIVASGLHAFETYGMTETASHIALRKIEKELNPFKTLEGITVKCDKDKSLVIYIGDDFEIKTNDLASIVSNKEFYLNGRKDDIIISGGRKINPYEIEEKIKNFIGNELIVTSLPDEKWGEKLILIIEKKSLSNNLFQREREAGKIDELNKEIFYEILTKEDVFQIKGILKNVLKPWEIPKEYFLIDRLGRTENGKLIRPKDPSFLVSFSPDNNLDV